MRKTILITTIALLLLGLTGSATAFFIGHTFEERLGSVWLVRQREGAISQTQYPNVPLSPQEMCDDIPRLDYIHTRPFDLPADAQTSSSEFDTALQTVLRKGSYAVRPLHIWGVYSDIGCKEPLGWGTAFLIGYFKNTSIWATVEHNVITAKYFDSIFGREIATNWFIQDDNGTFRELSLVGCREDKFCILTSSYIWMTSPLTLDDDSITNEIRLGEDAFIYGCSVVGERVKRYIHYKVHFFCIATTGKFTSRYALDTIVGGDVLVTAAAMPGFSGSPLLVMRDGTLFIVGTVNAGVEGVFTAVNFLLPQTISKTKEYLALGRELYGEK